MMFEIKGDDLFVWKMVKTSASEVKYDMVKVDERLVEFNGGLILTQNYKLNVKKVKNETVIRFKE